MGRSKGYPKRYHAGRLEVKILRFKPTIKIIAYNYEVVFRIIWDIRYEYNIIMK